MCTGEVLKYGQAFTEVSLNWRFDNLTCWLGHQAPHASKLPDLFDTTTSTGVGHQEYRVDVPIPQVVITLHRLHHVFGDVFASVRPKVEYRTVSFLRCHQTSVMALFELHDLLFGF